MGSYNRANVVINEEFFDNWKCDQMNCFHNEDQMCVRGDDWQQEYQEADTYAKEDLQEEYIEGVSVWEYIGDCEFFDEDDEKCEECGSELQTSYEQEEFWGAMVNRPVVYCPECDT